MPNLVAAIQMHCRTTVIITNNVNENEIYRLNFMACNSYICCRITCDRVLSGEAQHLLQYLHIKRPGKKVLGAGFHTFILCVSDLISQVLSPKCLVHLYSLDLASVQSPVILCLQWIHYNRNRVVR